MAADLASWNWEQYTYVMDIVSASAKNIQEAMNYETLIACTRHSDTTIEPLFERLSEHIDLSEPLTLHPDVYANTIGSPVYAVLNAYIQVKERFSLFKQDDVVLKRTDELYPAHVACSASSPRFLYLRGDIGLLKRRLVCVIGTRTPSKEGKEYARRTAQVLGSNGIVVTSGLALGIDGTAHLAALAHTYPTIAVIGTSLVESYPAEHRKLQKAIGEQGLLVSHISPSRQTQKWFFLVRNRLMSSLSEASIIVEDRDGGGAVKQAWYAVEQGKRVVLFKHTWEDRSLLWPRKLALQQGVIIVSGWQHIPARLSPVSNKNGRQMQMSLFDSY